MKTRLQKAFKTCSVKVVRGHFYISILVMLIYGKIAGGRIITFAGREWTVRSGYGGPGPNHWSNSEENVWIDENGWLHLKIRYENGTWYCSEVSSVQPTQYGTHRFYVIGRLDLFDRNVVFALFLYANDTTEVDIEFSRWGNEWSWFNSQYVVQPWYHTGNVERFWMSLNGTYTTHYINWQPDSIRFESIHGHYEEPPSWWYLIHSWLYTGADIPQENESLYVCINLWLCNGTPPSNGEEVEVVIEDIDLPPVGVEIQKYMEFGININSIAFDGVYFKYTLPIMINCATLYIYDITGKVIRKWVLKNQQSGDYVIYWNGTNNYGYKVAPGVYFFHLQSDGVKVVRKFLLLK